MPALDETRRESFSEDVSFKLRRNQGARPGRVRGTSVPEEYAAGVEAAREAGALCA